MHYKKLMQVQRIVQIFRMVRHECKIKRFLYNFIQKFFKIKQKYSNFNSKWIQNNHIKGEGNC